MNLIYIPRTVDDDELEFAHTVSVTVETLVLAMARLDDLTSRDEPGEAYMLGFDVWHALDSKIDDLIDAMRNHGWLAMYDLKGNVTAFVRDNLEVSVS